APGSSDSKNTSLKCMSLVYNHEKKDEILQNIIDNVLRNEDSARAFSDTLQMMYGVCVCGDDSYINQSYSTRIFNHRTCYGIIMQTNEILEHMFNTDNKERSCSLLGAIPHQKDIANMSDFALEAYNK